MASRRFRQVADNGWLLLELDRPAPAGAYTLTASDPQGTVGWWSHTEDKLPGGQADEDGVPTAGDRTLRLVSTGSRTEAIRRFFTFRKPQPDYFQGPTGPNQWSWLEVGPQHVFRNGRGEKEEMGVGVAQNAVRGRLGSMSEPGAQGRSFHNGATDTRPKAVRWGLNFAEQWRRALKENPKALFVTGWNEWIAGRFNEFGGVKLPVMFVDEFDQEHSRDIEPMKGGHGDDYYYQLVSYVRRYKGVRPPAPPTPPASLRVGAGFGQWRRAGMEFRDDAGDTAWRDSPGFAGRGHYTNRTGRNDFVELRVAHDARAVHFYARTRNPITPRTDPRWMMLLVDTDRSHRTGWEGYDLIVNRLSPDGRTALLERNVGGGWSWKPVARVRYAVAGREIHLAVPRSALGLTQPKAPFSLEFKWADNVPASAHIVDWLDGGDTAPNGRFNYVYSGRR